MGAAANLDPGPDGAALPAKRPAYDHVPQGQGRAVRGERACRGHHAEAHPLQGEIGRKVSFARLVGDSTKPGEGVLAFTYTGFVSKEYICIMASCQSLRPVT